MSSRPSKSKGYSIWSWILYKEIRANELNSMLKEFCLDEFTKEMQDSGKELKPEIGELTCNCFINNIQNGNSLILARQDCKEKVSNTFNL